MGRTNYKGTEGNFSSMDIFCGDGFMVIYKSKIIKSYILNMYSLYVNYISIKLSLKSMVSTEEQTFAVARVESRRE